MTQPGPGNVAQPGPGKVAQPGPGNVAQPGPGKVAQPGPGNVAQPGPGNVAQPPASAGAPWPVSPAPAMTAHVTGPGSVGAPGGGWTTWPTASSAPAPLPAWPAGPGPTGPPGSARRRPWFRLVAGLIALVALIGGATVAVETAVQVQVRAPGEVVQSYFAALRAGDAPGALSYGPTPPGDHSFLTSTALAAQNRLAAMGSVRVEAATVSGRTARVPVTYTLTPAAAPTRPSIQTTDVALHRHGRGWSLDRTAALVQVLPTSAGHRATLAGAAVPAHPVALFPGIAPVQYDTTFLEQQLASGYVTLASAGTVKVGAQLSDSGRASVDAAVRAAFRSCLSRPTAAASRSCPLSPTTSGRVVSATSSARVVPGSLRGTLRQAAFDGAPVLRDADGLVTTSGLFYVDGRYQTLNFDNLAATATGSVQVDFVAALYVTGAGTVRWEGP